MTELARSPSAQHGPPALVLPWAQRPDGHCFGCAPANPVGLGLRFRPDGDALVAEFCLDRRYESYPGVVHGGIVSLVCDEVMGNQVVLSRGGPAVTTSLRVRYLGVVAVGGRYRCRATTEDAGSGTVAGRAEVRDAAGELVATATAGYRPLPADAAGLPITAARHPTP